MNVIELTPDDLLAGSNLTFDLVIPSSILRPGAADVPAEGKESSELVVQLRPLTVGTFQLIMKAARNDPGVVPLLMIKESLVQPKMSLDQVKGMHLGLVSFLIAQIRQISGLTEKKSLLMN